jgi:hypothetical protein
MPKKSVLKITESWKIEKKITKEVINSDCASAPVKRNNCKGSAGKNISLTGILGDVKVVIVGANKERPS